jgi:pentatricopeptide repeat protein
VHPNDQSLRIFLQFHSKNGDVPRALEIYRLMVDYEVFLTPDDFHTLLACCLKARDLMTARDVYAEMKLACAPTEETVTIMINISRVCNDPEAEHMYWEERLKFLAASKTGQHTHHPKPTEDKRTGGISKVMKGSNTKILNPEAPILQPTRQKQQ